MRQLLVLALLSLSPGISLAAYEDVPIRRSLANLQLGDSLRAIKSIYKPAQEWPSYMEPRGHVTRIRVERSYLKRPDAKFETMWLGMKHGRLVEIQLIYDAAATRAKPAEALAVDWSVIYGEPKRSDDGKFWWSDGSTVMRVFSAEVPVLEGQGQSVELRTSIQIMNEGIFERVD